MPVQNQLHEIIFTGNVAVSHIGLYMQEPDVTMFTLFGNLITGDMQPINILCDFGQLNELLSVAHDGSEEAIGKLSTLVSTGYTDGETIDLTETGGLHFLQVLFCLERISNFYEEDEDETGASTPQYIIREVISEGFAIQVFEKMFSYHDKQSKFNSALCSLAIQYEFYQRFMQQGIQQKEALRLSLLQGRKDLMLAVQQYYTLKLMMEK